MQTRMAKTNDMALEEVVSRLSSRSAVHGLILVGSTIEGPMQPYSDYDLVVILKDHSVPLHVGTTYVGGRLTDLLFHTLSQVDEILEAAEPIDSQAWLGRLVSWLREGKIIFDRSGQLRRAQEKVRSGGWLKGESFAQVYSAWYRLNYNLRHNRRLLRSGDPICLPALDLRLLYALADLFLYYFIFRGLPWRGEKAAIRYWTEHDPEYLNLFQQCLAETDRRRKFALYEQLSALTAATVGGLWEGNATALQTEPERELQPSTLETALDFWDSLTI